MNEWWQQQQQQQQQAAAAEEEEDAADRPSCDNVTVHNTTGTTGYYQ
jgi:hypothetical protein